MTYTSTTNKTVTLTDGTKLSNDFYGLIKNQATARYEALRFQENYTIDDILGADLAFVFTPVAAINISKAFDTMVAHAEVPYAEVDTTAHYGAYYQLIPRTPDLQSLPF